MDFHEQILICNNNVGTIHEIHAIPEILWKSMNTNLPICDLNNSNFQQNTQLKC